MTNHPMPVLNEALRQALIADCKAEIADLEGFIESYKPKFTDNYSATNLYQIKSQLQRQQIALASLQAEPEPGLFTRATEIKPVKGRISITQATPMANGEFHHSCFKLYTAPPVPALNLISLPDGWKLVPVKADMKMIKAGAAAARQCLEETGGNNPSVIYSAMVKEALEGP